MENSLLTFYLLFLEEYNNTYFKQFLPLEWFLLKVIYIF